MSNYYSILVYDHINDNIRQEFDPLFNNLTEAKEFRESVEVLLEVLEKIDLDQYSVEIVEYNIDNVTIRYVDI